MTEPMSDKRVCIECGWHGLAGDMLEGQNPFARYETILGCPRCKAIGSIGVVCDGPGCWLLVTCGTATNTGYRLTCSKHKPTGERGA